MSDGDHGAGCRLKPGHRWRSCVCAEVDPADRPCAPCEMLELAAETCPSCAKIRDERVTGKRPGDP